ncbi:MAG: MiaB/RimO family radical SAM methylthiotransferase [Elusimicrobiota bacterium]|jgi:threonylcarbamoyladenosine tRNA methylthiotransferase MtaB|nr:MiaB/RimO family radical SAM methylthiotransferase [Elusimicrobiota bacterium]
MREILASAAIAHLYISADKRGKLLKKYFIYTFGCKVNKYESQLIAQKLNRNGFAASKNLENADIIIFNSCCVTNDADKECEYFIRKALKLDPFPKIILTGCLAKYKYSHLKTAFPQIEIIPDKNSLYDNPQQTINNFDNRSRAFLKIQDGCDSFCSYCIIPYVRNSLWSKPIETVLSEIETLVDKNYFEIVLTGIHIGKFNGGLWSLLKRIVEIPRNFRVRLSSVELNEIDENLVGLIKDNPDKICSHLHIPLQSGSDKILSLMNRKYRAKDYEKKINELSRLMTNICLSADIIVGFPQETSSLHKETLNFLSNNPFSRLHVFRYSDRNGTKASTLDNKVSIEEIKKRSKEVLLIDEQKRKIFLAQNIGKKRQAVCIGANKVLTDNYISAKNLKNQKGIFEIEIDNNCTM